MGISLFFLFIVILIFSNFIAKRYQSKLLIISTLIMGMIMGGAYAIPDYNMYDSMYTASIMNFDYSFDYKESAQGGYSRNIGYTILNNVIGSIGLSYQEYKIVTSIMLLFILFLYIRKIVPNIAPVILLYILYPFFMDIIQLRVLYTEVILLVGLYYLTKFHNKRLGTFIFIILTLLAGTFHSMAWLWLLFVPFRLLLQSRVLRFIPYLFILIGITLPIYANLIAESFLPIMYMMAESDVTSHYQIYTMGSSVRLGYLYVWGYDLVILGLLYKMKKIVANQSVSNFHRIFVENTYILFLFLACILPASAIATESFRWSRVLMLESYISLIIYSKYDKNVIRKIVIALSLVVVTMAAAYLNFYEGSAEFVLSVLDKNVFFDW